MTCSCRAHTLDKTELEKELTGDILFSEKWLLAYEAVKKGWLSPLNPSLINDNIFFKILFDKDIEFYENSKQLLVSTKSSKIKEQIELIKYADKSKIENTNQEKDIKQDNIPDFPSNIF